MSIPLLKQDRFGLLRPSIDAHTLGLSSLAQMLGECGTPCVLADEATCVCLNAPDVCENMDPIVKWIRDTNVTILGFSYRLNPEDGLRLTTLLARGLADRRLFTAQGGPIRALYFAGLPRTCALVREQVRIVTATFDGDETSAETLMRLGVSTAAIPRELAVQVRYDEDRLAFGRDLISKGDYLGVGAPDRSGYPGFGTRQDTLLARLDRGKAQNLLPLMRAHAGPFLPDRAEAVRLFLDWTRQLAASGHLDVLSIGTSQLSQSRFGEEWGDTPNGGGVPLNTPDEFAAVWQAARPMLVRTYAGTRNLSALARMYEEQINIAWHALSLWWFCRIDGRGPYSLRENLDEQFATLRYIAATGKPYEPNVSHHFAFRGGDDVTGVVAAVLAARTAKAVGIRTLILQAMLNTPRATWGVQDLAKVRVTLRLVRPLEDATFRVILQPRGGLDYFSPSPEKAKAQLAAVTALMDDIEPHDPTSPPLVHVVSFSEGYELADPAVIDESIRIVRHAFAEYRRLRGKGDVDDMSVHPNVESRTRELQSEVQTVLAAIEAHIREPYTPAGLYQAFAMGFLPTPYLWECRDELAKAVQWRTRLVQGSVKVVDGSGVPVSAATRMGSVRTI